MGASPHILALREKIGNDLICATSVSSALFDEAGRLLMAHDRKLGRWITVGGMIDPHESPATAVVRETFEETGLIARPLRLFGVFGGPHNEIVYDNGDRVSFTAIGFIMEITGGALRADGEEIERLAWVTREEAAAFESSEIIREIVDAAFADYAAGGARAPYFAPPADTAI